MLPQLLKPVTQALGVLPLTPKLTNLTPISPTTWHFHLPDHNARRNPLLLLTIAGIAVQAPWCGQLGEHFVAWANFKGH